MSSTTVLQPRGTIRYEEPSLALVLTLTSFVYLLNVARRVVDSLVGCGLVGQIAVGVVYGPVAKILPADVEHAFVALGYVGLVLVVFEGGLTLEPNRFARALPLSLASALVGILVPLALTFALFAAAFAYPTVDAFAAGSALASTSLGTTFFVLRSTGDAVDDTDIAQVLKGAALADDIVALVLLSVISSLGQGGGGIDAWTIARPIVASVALCLVSPVVIRFVLAPVFATEFVSNGVARGGKQGKLLIGVVVLSAYLAIAYYSGTTVLLGAFLAGVTLPFLSRARNDDMPVSSHKTTTATSNETEVGVDFVATYEYYVEPIQTTILVPFFFASIGYSIPFLELWRARVVWRGIIYSVLMVCGKVVVGVCVIVHDGAVAALSSSSSPSNRSGDVQQERESGPAANTFAELGLCRLQEGGADVIDRTRDERSEGRTSRRRGRVFVRETLPAATFLGLALVARGEIGVLVLQVAYNSAASSGDSSVVLGTEPYLVSIWAVAVCTVVGPIAFARVVATEWAREGVREWGRGRG